MLTIWACCFYVRRVTEIGLYILRIEVRVFKLKWVNRNVGITNNIAINDFKMLLFLLLWLLFIFYFSGQKKTFHHWIIKIVHSPDKWFILVLSKAKNITENKMCCMSINHLFVVAAVDRSKNKYQNTKQSI